VADRLERIMTTAVAEVFRISRERKVSMRTAAYILGVGRVAKATELRGVYP
jgi:glutamate dehydrogenase (NAD(P)+)